jgi:hypothetical protein
MTGIHSFEIMVATNKAARSHISAEHNPNFHRHKTSDITHSWCSRSGCSEYPNIKQSIPLKNRENFPMEELYNLYSSRNIIRVIKSKKIKWMRNAARIWEKLNA